MDIPLSEFADRMTEIMPVLMKEFTKRLLKELSKCKVTIPQLFILEFLNREAELRMTDLAHFMNVTTAAMTGIVDRLVRDGYVGRNYDPEDRRIIKIKLTASGVDIIKKLNAQRHQMIVKTFGKISETDRRDYLRILMKIKDVLTKEQYV